MPDTPIPPKKPAEEPKAEPAAPETKPDPTTALIDLLRSSQQQQGESARESQKQSTRATLPSSARVTQLDRVLPS